MSRISFLAAVLLGYALLAAAGCATKMTVADAPAGAAAPRRVPLVACYMPDNYSSMLAGRRYATVKYIRDSGGVFEVEKPNWQALDADCDVRLVVGTNSPKVDAYAARSGRGLFSMKGSFGFTANKEIRKALVEKFADPELIASILEERPGAAKAASAAPAPAPSPAALPAARPLVSEVDTPSYRGTARADDFALVIGVEEYQALPKADHGVRDAQAVRKHLEALGFPARNIISLEGSQATGNKLKSYLEEWLPLNVKPSSTLFVFYSGHGAPDPQSGDAYLVPWDGDPAFLRSTAYPLKKLYADLAKTKARKVVVALDACFSGAGGRSVLAKGARPLVAKVAGIAAGGRVTVLAAASGEQITGSLDEQGHGMFTYFLLKGLAEGKRTAKSLHEYLTPRVEDEARRQNRQQTPTFSGADAEL